jgi:ABC-type transporter Mla subunit MlaD
MECHSCGNRVSADAKFCSQCGDKIPELVDNATEAVGQLSALDEQSVQLIQLATAQLKDFTKVKASSLRAYRSIQDAAEAVAEVKRAGDGLAAWFGLGKTQKIMAKLASELTVTLMELHSIALTTDSPRAEAQAKELANLISTAIDAANIVRSFHDAPYAQLSVQQAYGHLDAVGRELASFLK